MKKQIYYYGFLICILLSYSCTDVIDVDLSKTKKRLVVDASISWLKGTTGKKQTIRLSKTADFFNPKKESVTNAIVYITKNNSSKKISFTHKENGEYQTESFIPELGQLYTLHISYNGQEYQAKESLIPVSNITRVNQSRQSIFNRDLTRIEFFYKDSLKVKNYYLGEFNYNKSPSLFVRDDRFSDGNENSMSYVDADIKTDDVLKFSLYGISERYYNYMKILISLSKKSGNPFQSNPVSLKGNCKNINNPDEEVLGYFRLSEVNKKDYVVK